MSETIANALDVSCVTDDFICGTHEMSDYTLDLRFIVIAIALRFVILDW